MFPTYHFVPTGGRYHWQYLEWIALHITVDFHLLVLSIELARFAAMSELSRLDVAHLQQFSFERVLNEDPLTHSLILLGYMPDPSSGQTVNAIVRIEKTALKPDDGPNFFGGNALIETMALEESTDIYSWLFGWFGNQTRRPADVKVNVICPATEVHIRKYTKQEQILIRETPAVYQKYTKPYVDKFPAARTQWVEDILNGKSEQNKMLYSSPEYVILPDMKWDGMTLTSLYLLAIVHDRTIRSLRDLRKKHLGLLRSIYDEAHRIVQEKWGLGPGSLRMHVHYQPSYYHFHVHIVNANYQGGLGMIIGQAHLLDDIISLLELDPDEGPGIFERMTLTYGIGDQHGLYEVMRHATENVQANA